LRTIAGFFEKYPLVEKKSLPIPGTMEADPQKTVGWST